MDRYWWLNDDSRKFMSRGYVVNGQTVEQRVRVVADTAAGILGMPELADQIEDDVARGYYSLSTPIWANFGTNRGLPISCFGSTIEDDMASILQTHAEVGMMTKLGGGTSAYFGNLRGRGAPIRDNGESSGSVNFIQMFDSAMKILSQGSTRRGNFAAYLDIDHSDIDEFLTIRSDSSTIQGVHSGVCVPDSFMRGMIDGDAKKRAVWAKVLAARMNSGEPYLFFTDNANAGRPQVYKDLGLEITHSQLCTEIFLPDSALESFVCDLLSMNAVTFREWKNTGAVRRALFLLDAVMTEFIRKASEIPFMERAVRFARRHRAVGIGVMGWHSLLQRSSIAFESMDAKYLNVELFKHIREESYAASAELAKIFGEPEVMEGRGMRNATTMAVAPTQSTAFILGQVSEGIQPIMANYEVKDRAKGKFVVKNQTLVELLQARGRNDKPTWDAIINDNGSVRSLDCLDDHEKGVFKTWSELSQREVVIQAAQRQKFIDQGQSLNLLIHPSTPIKDVNALYIEGWKLGLKSFYYQFSVNAAQELSSSLLSCKSCEA